MNKKTKEIKAALLAKPKKEEPLRKEDLLSTGSTLLNLACTGKPEGGFVKGKYIFVVGDSSSGKTFLVLTCLAEASIDKNFKTHRFIYDNVEDGALMDFEKFFGKAAADRIEPPRVVDGVPVYSETIEDFYFHIDDAGKGKKPFIYILDSMDSLSSKYEGKKFEEKKNAARGSTKAKGDYGDGKAKINSSGLRRVLSHLRASGSILIILNQTRDNVDAGQFESKKTRSGGHALKFYATLELWSSVGKKLEKTYRNKKRQLGITCRVQVKKNRLTGKDRVIEIPIFHSHGMDDIGSCAAYLVSEGHWKKNKDSGIISATDFNFEGRMEPLIAHIEESGLEKDLRLLVTETWNEIEAACAVSRKSRY